MPDPTCPAGSEPQSGAPTVVYLTVDDYAAAWGDVWPLILPLVPIPPWTPLLIEDLCAEPPTGPFDIDLATVIELFRRDPGAIFELPQIALNRLMWHVWNTYCQCTAAPTDPGDDCYNAGTEAAGPLVWWKLNEASGTTAADSSGNGYSGTMSGTAAFGATGPFADTAVQLSSPGGKGERTGITVPTGRYGFMAWIRPNAYHTSPNNVHQIFDFYSSVTGGQQDHVQAYLQATNATTASLQFRITRSGGTTSTLGGGGIPLDQWTHIAGIHEADGTMRVYVNGAQTGSAAAAHNFDLRGASNGWLLFGTANAAGDYFSGMVSGLAIVQNLSVAEVEAAYDQAVNGCILGEPGPIDEPPAAALPEGITAPPAYSCDPEDLCAQFELLRNQLVLVREEVTVIQRQAAPFGYRLASTHTGLSGSGTISVASILAVSVDFTTIPTFKARRGTAVLDYMDVGWLSLGNADGWQERITLRHDQQFIPGVPGHITTVGYDLAPGVVATLRTYRRLT